MAPDDAPRGRVLTRREVMALLGAAPLALVAARASAAAVCVATPAQTEGPFFVDTRLERRDVRSDPATGAVRAGAPLALELTVSRMAAGGCAPLAGAVVDIWHCDADGVYSGTQGPERFLRGYQVSDADGRVRFVTIYPGWYPGRAVHIHFKVRSAARELTSQLYFDDAFSERVFARAPYAARGRASVSNGRDFLYRQGGRELTLTPVERDGGLAAAFDIALQMT